MNKSRSQILVSHVPGSSGAPGVKETAARNKSPLEGDFVSAVMKVKAQETNAEVVHLNKVEEYLTFADLIHMKSDKAIRMETDYYRTP